MDFEKIINNLKSKTAFMIKKEDLINLNLIFEKEPNQIFHFSELIEQQIKKILLRQKDIFELGDFRANFHSICLITKKLA